MAETKPDYEFIIIIPTNLLDSNQEIECIDDVIEKSILFY